MKKINLLLIAFLLINTYYASSQTFNKGNGVLNLTIGFGNGLNYGYTPTSSSPAFAASYEVGVADNIIDKGSIGVGGYFGYASSKYEYNSGGYSWGYKYSNIVIGPRGSFHYPFVDKLDTYAGLMIAYNIVTSKETGNFPSVGTYTGSNSDVITAGFIGARYYFNEKVAGVAELGWGVAYFNIGVAFKLK